MSQYPTSLPNSIFMLPLKENKNQPTPLFLHLMEKKIVLKGRIIKQKKSSFKKPAEQTLIEMISSQSRKSDQPCSATISHDKKQWKPRLNNAFIKGEKQRLRSRLDYMEEADIELVSYLQLKCSSVFSRKYQYRDKSLMSKETQSQMLSKMTSSNSQSPNVNPLFKETKQKVGTFIENRGEPKINKIVQRAVSRQSVEIKSTRTKNLRTSLNTSPNKYLQTEKADDQKNNKKPLLQYNRDELGHVKAESYCVIESTGKLVINYRANKSCQIASLTKIMTAYLVLRICNDQKIDMAFEKVEVQEYVEDTTGTSAELIHGDIFSIEQLLYALLLPSGNDAALVLADWGGMKLTNNYKATSRQNISKFVQEMSRYSHKLGMSSTRYGNPHGLPHPEGTSTAFDQCKLAALCLQSTILSKIFKTQKYQFSIINSDDKKRQGVWENTNKLLRRDGFIGVKTGITVTAGPCLITAYHFKNKTYIASVLRSSKISRRFKDSRKILHWVLSKIYTGRTSYQETLQLQKLIKNNKDLDSDNSQDQHQFKYGKEGAKQLLRRNKILINQL